MCLQIFGRDVKQLIFQMCAFNVANGLQVKITCVSIIYLKVTIIFAILQP